jgi:hypothetical protein
MSDGPTLLQKVLLVAFLAAALTAFIWQARMMWLQDIKKVVCTKDGEKAEGQNEAPHIDVKV